MAILYSLAEAKVLIEAWRRHYNTIRPPQQPRLSTVSPENGFVAIAAWRWSEAEPEGGNGNGGNSVESVIGMRCV